MSLELHPHDQPKSVARCLASPTPAHRSRPADTPVRVCAAVTCLLVAAGCAPTPPVGEWPEGRGPEPEVSRTWECETLEGGDAGPWSGGFDGWATGGGTLTSVHATSPEDPDVPGTREPRDALVSAAGSAADAALDLLAQRGIEYTPARRSAIRNRVIAAVERGADIDFPRMSVLSVDRERCVARATADTVWRARVAVEYPIGLLRGDVENVRWERRRARREVDVIMESAEDYLARGYWLSGFSEIRRAAELIEGVGVPLATGAASGDTVSPGSTVGPSEDEPIDVLFRRLTGSTLAAEASGGWLEMRPAGQIAVVEVDAGVGTETGVVLSYEWRGNRVPAIGVPIVFDMPEAAAILDGDAVTDDTGTARCRIVSVRGETGRYELVASVDTSALGIRPTRTERRLTLADTTSTVSGGGDGPSPRPWDVPVSVSQTVFVTRGAHGISICAEFDSEPARDASQVRAGFVKRMERDGFDVADCGPEVDVVARGTVEMATLAEPGSWTAQVTVTGSAFDQRSAVDLGETAVTVVETTEEGQRETQVLALKEAGRLLAAYFAKRIVMSGK